MKKTNSIKAILILIIGVILISVSTSVFAADNEYTELTLNNTSTNNTNVSNSNTNKTNTNTNTNKTNTNTNKTNTNSSLYNNTSLPKTGIEDSIPVALLVTVFGISAVYAYKKISDYRNI